MHHGSKHNTLRALVLRSVEEYFANLHGAPPTNVYKLVKAEVEQALLQGVLQFTAGNQTQAAKILGISRNTLRSKIKAYAK